MRFASVSLRANEKAIPPAPRAAANAVGCTPKMGLSMSVNAMTQMENFTTFEMMLGLGIFASRLTPHNFLIIICATMVRMRAMMTMTATIMMRSVHVVAGVESASAASAGSVFCDIVSSLTA